MKKLSLILSAVMMTAMLISSCGGGASNEAASGASNEVTSVASNEVTSSASNEVTSDASDEVTSSASNEATSGASDEVTIGKQVWMTANLNVDKFRNGDSIPVANTKEEWVKAGENKQPAWCYYVNDPDNGDRYGKLYNWYAVHDPRGLAPEGWKIPSFEDWSGLINFMTKSCDGHCPDGKLKYTDFWASYGQGRSGTGTNESGFSGLPGGFRYSYGSFSSLEHRGYWWSWSEDVTAVFFANYYKLEKENGGGFIGSEKKSSGLSVRCLRVFDLW